MQERHKGETVEGGGLCMKVGLGEQCLSFDILFLATPPPPPISLLTLPVSLPESLPVSLPVSPPASLPIFLLVSLLVSLL